MLESHTDSAVGTWGVGQYAFTIEYSLRVLDDIRLAVVDAFFSLPRGGAEIGGILLGRNAGRNVTIVDYVPLDCEHATGPSFVLSANDHAGLAERLASARGNASGIQPVGWYHSHTRSEIHLSSEDLEVHDRYFPEAWQVALVLKPHTFQPTRAGFFFREADGSIYAKASYREFALDPLGIRPLPDPAPPASKPGRPLNQYPEPAGPVITTPAIPQQPEAYRNVEQVPVPVAPSSVENAPLKSAVRDIPPAKSTPPESVPPKTAAPESIIPDTKPSSKPETLEVAPPSFTQQVASQRSWGGWGILVALGIGLLGGGVAYQTRQYWLPRVTSWGQPPAKPPFIGLTAMDTDGQLQIRWDRDSPAVRSAEGASLVIDGGGGPEGLQLDPAHLRGGSFTYGRQSERVEVALTLHGPAGQTLREMTTYLGKLPYPKPAEADPAPAKQPDDEIEALRARNRKLEKTVEDLRLEIRKAEKRRRMQNQNSGK